MKKAIIFILYTSFSMASYGNSCEKSFTASRIIDEFKQFPGVSSFFQRREKPAKTSFRRQLNDKQYRAQFKKLKTRDEKFALIENQLHYDKPSLTMIVSLADLGGPKALELLKKIFDNKNHTDNQFHAALVIQRIDDPHSARELFNYILISIDTMDTKKHSDTLLGLAFSAHKAGEEGIRFIQSLKDHPVVFFRRQIVMNAEDMKKKHLILQEFIDDKSLLVQDRLVYLAFKLENRSALETLAKRSDPIVKMKAQQALAALSKNSEWDSNKSSNELKQLESLAKSSDLQIKKAVIDRLIEYHPLFIRDILKILQRDPDIHVSLYLIEKAWLLSYTTGIFLHLAEKRDSRLNQAIVSSVLSNKDLNIWDLHHILEGLVDSPYSADTRLAKHIADKLQEERRLPQLSNKLMRAFIDL